MMKTVEIAIFQVEPSQMIEELTHPKVTDHPERVHEVVKIFKDAYTATKGTHAIVICTEWDEFTVSRSLPIDTIVYF